MGPLGEVGMHDRPLEIRAQKYVSKVDSGVRAPQLPCTSRRHGDWGRSRSPWMEGGIRTFQGWAHLSPRARLDLSFFVVPHITLFSLKANLLQNFP